MDAPQLSVVVPTYGSSASLEPLVSGLREVLESYGLTFEVVLVNDASPDDSWEVLERLALSAPFLHVIDLQTNHGQARATLCGLAHARGELIATMDDDLQQPPEELPTLLRALEQHPDWDAVVGSWPRDQSPLRNFGSWVHALADRIAYGTPPDWRHTTFRVMRRPVVEALLANETRTPVVGPLLRQVSDRVHNVEVEHRERAYGRSQFRVRHGIASVAANFFSASTLPLRALSALGIFSAAVAFLVGLVYLIGTVTGLMTPPPGYMSTFLALTFFAGATLFGLGLLGEYMALVMREVRRPPRWIIRRTITGAAESRQTQDRTAPPR